MKCQLWIHIVGSLIYCSSRMKPSKFINRSLITFHTTDVDSVCSKVKSKTAKGHTLHKRMRNIRYEGTHNHS